MVKVFNILIAATFFLSQAVNVNASHLRNAPHEEEVANYAMEQVNDTTSTAIRMAALHVPAVSYSTTTETASEGKFEKVVEPMTIAAAVMLGGFVLSSITSVIGWIKDIVSIFK
ncbi:MULTISPECIES: hypothetical protein [unclassified Bartonella]|uniref:hypothetical protein n=1 Tax=unclassified Bartonella TaxID=2645622 RepID=UPI00235DF1D4|nr:MULTISPECIES: hypothetical protein [unclassified Bartonella]